MSELLAIPELLTEAQAYERYGDVLQDKELRRARQHRLIGYYARKGKILYRSDELQAFVLARLEGSYMPCQKPSNSDVTGLPKPADQTNSIASGMSKELEKSGADHLKREISRKPKSGSRRSSSEKATLSLVRQDQSNS